MGNGQGRPIVFTDQGLFSLALLQSIFVPSPWCLVDLKVLLFVLPVADFGVSTVQLEHFKLLRVVGKGAFGKVRIVERRDTGLTFALKYIRKDEGQYIEFCLVLRPKPEGLHDAPKSRISMTD